MEKFSALSIIRSESFHEAAAHLARYWSGTYSVVRAPNEMAELWMEKRLALIVETLPPEFADDYKQWKKRKRDDEGGFVLHAFVEASVPECLLGVVLANIDENFVTDRAWTIPAMNIVTT